MEIFIDSADLDELRDAAAMGVVDGVTTNPSLVAKSSVVRDGGSLRDLIVQICEIIDGPVSAEVLSTDAEGIVNEGRELAKLHDNVVVKVPLIGEGLKAVKKLTAEGIRTNVTLCFSPTQALLTAKAGATYISPFIGRLDDVSTEGMELIEQILEIYLNYELDTKVLAASIRHPMHVTQAALVGAHVATIPHKVIAQLLKHPLTDIGLERFLKDAGVRA